MSKKEALVSLLCERYYQRLSNAGPDPMPGQIVFAHGVYPPDEPWIIQAIKYDGFNPQNSRYEVKKYQRDDRNNIPIAELQVQGDELLYVYKGKQRPFVILGVVKSKWKNALYEDTIFSCAPLFTFKKRHSEEFRIRCASFVFPDLFYLPAEADGCSEEGAIRFEYIQPIAKKGLHPYFAGSPSQPIALTDQAFALFLNHLSRFMFRRDLDQSVCETIDTYQKIVLDELDAAKNLGARN